MGRHAVGILESFVGDAAPVRGRTVVGLGIALGLAVGLGTWALSDPPARRQQQPVAQPANMPPPADVLPPPTLVPPTDDGKDEIGPAPTTPPATPPADREPVARKPPPPSKSPEAVPALTARYDTRHVWDEGYVADVHVTNPASTAQSFKVRLDLPRGVRLTDQVWNATPDDNDGSVTFRGGPVPAGQTLTFGFVADKSRYQRFFQPTACTVNGNPCEGFEPRLYGDRYVGWQYG